MQSIYLTPASIGYLNLFILSFLIALYLGARAIPNRREWAQNKEYILPAAFLFVTFFSALLFWEASLLPPNKLIANYLENVPMALLLSAIVQYTYHFPSPLKSQRTERRVVFALTILYILFEIGSAAWRISILREGRVEFRHNLADLPLMFGFFWVAIIFIRNSFQHANRRASIQFALIFLIPLWLTIISILRFFYAISTPFYHVNLSVGSLFTVFLFALNNLTFQPEKTSFIVKLSGAALTAVMAVFGTLAWLVGPAYAAQYQPAILDHRSIRFTPNAAGGYDAAEIPFQFEEEFGRKLDLADSGAESDPVYRADFQFPFLGEQYDSIFISDDGALGMGSSFTWQSYQYNFSSIPMIMPLLADLDSPAAPNQGTFLRVTPDRLTVTWLDAPAHNQPDARYTYQAALFADGSFIFTYNGLRGLIYYVDDRPDSTLWAMGFKPAQTPSADVNFTRLPLQSGPEGAIQDEYRSFRRYMHGFMVPIAIAVLVSDAFFVLGLPLLLIQNFSLPLQNLIRGVQDFNSGKHRKEIPVQVNDEIGLLTSAFNSMTGELDSLISNLEARVEKRTSELIDANSALQTSQRFFEGLFEISPDAIVTVNAEGKITRVNARAEELFGYTRIELIGQPIETLIPDQLTSSHIAKRTRYQKEPHPHQVGGNLDIFGRRRNGREFPVDILLSPFETKDGSLILTVIRDISERVQMEKTLRRHNDTLGALEKMMLDLADRHDLDDILRALLEKTAPLMDASDVSIDLVQNGDTLVNYANMSEHPIRAGDTLRREEGGRLSWQAIDTRQPAVLEDYSTWEHRRTIFDQRPIHAIMIVPILQGENALGTITFYRYDLNRPFTELDVYAGSQLAQMVALSMDNSRLYSQLRSELVERRQIEEVLRISQENFMSYFNMGSVGMCVITPEKNWVEVNDRLCRMLGYTRDELKRLHWNDLTHPNDLVAEASLFELTLRDEYESRQMNKRFLRKDGSVAYTSMYVSCQRHTDQSAWYFLVSLVDITERILQEQALQQAQAELMEQRLTSATLEERQRLARNLHDSLSQSVHSLVLFSQTLQSALDKNNIERARRIVEQVQESARQSHKETRLLLFELQAPGKGRNVDLIRDLENRLAKVENHAGIGSQIVQKGSLKHIPSKWLEDLYWMIIEALNNALKHAQARKMRIVINASPQELEVEVIDDGRGFSVAKVGAGGMGLANLRERAALLGGELTIDSEPTKGTCVRFHVKIKEQDGEHTNPDR